MASYEINNLAIMGVFAVLDFIKYYSLANRWRYAQIIVIVNDTNKKERSGPVAITGKRGKNVRTDHEIDQESTSVVYK